MANLLRQLGRNIFTSWASLGIRALIVFLVNPFIIHTLGNDRYGVWVLAVSIINYLTVLDLGLRQGLIRYVSKFLGLREYDRLNAVLNSAFLIYSGIGLVVVAITVVLSLVALPFFNISPEHIDQARVVLIIVGLATAINFVLSAWGNSHGAFHRYDIANGLSIGEDILRTVAIIVLLKNGYGLIPFAGAYLGFSLIRLVAGSRILFRLFPPVSWRPGLADREAVRLLKNYGLISFLISVAWLLIANTDNVIIGYFLDTAAVTQYAIAAGFIVYLRAFIQAVGFPLRPVLSHYEAAGKRDSIIHIYTRLSGYLYFVTFAVAGATLIYADRLIYLWLGEGFAESARVLRILIVPAALFLPQAVANSVMFAVERHKLLLYLFALEGVANVALSLFLVRRYGLVGVAWGTAVAQIFIYLIILPFVIRLLLGIKRYRFYYRLFYSAVPAFGLAFGFSYLVMSFLPPENWGFFFGEIMLVGVVVAVSGYFVFGGEELRSDWKKIRSG